MGAQWASLGAYKVGCMCLSDRPRVAGSPVVTTGPVTGPVGVPHPPPSRHGMLCAMLLWHIPNEWATRSTYKVGCMCHLDHPRVLGSPTGPVTPAGWVVHACMHATHMHSKQASSMVWYAAMAKGWASMGMRLVACMHACASWSVQEWSGRVGSLTGACMHACMGQHMSCHQCLRGMIWLHHNTKGACLLVSMLCPCMVHSLHSLHSTQHWWHHGMHACTHTSMGLGKLSGWLAQQQGGVGRGHMYVYGWVCNTTPHHMHACSWLRGLFGCLGSVHTPTPTQPHACKCPCPSSTHSHSPPPPEGAH